MEKQDEVAAQTALLEGENAGSVAHAIAEEVAEAIHDSPKLSEKDVSSIAEKTVELMSQLHQARWVDSETHAEHHAWVEACIGREKERTQFRQKVTQSTVAFVLPLVVIWVAHSIWKSVVDAIKVGLK